MVLRTPDIVLTWCWLMINQVISQHRVNPPAVPMGVSRARFELPLKTQGELEAAVCEGLASFEESYMGRGPTDIRAHLIGDMLVVRLRNVLTDPEKHLVNSLPADKGRDLIKLVRTNLIETANPLLQAMVQEITGVKVVSLHHDISTVTGEEVVVFTLARIPASRHPRQRLD